MRNTMTKSQRRRVALDALAEEALQHAERMLAEAYRADADMAMNGSTTKQRAYYTRVATVLRDAAATFDELGRARPIAPREGR